MLKTSLKPLNKKAYGSIAHLPISKMGQGDKRIHVGQAKICLEKLRDKHDEIIVQEKLDGSCVSVAKINNEIVALNRSGYLSTSSPYKQHHEFAKWVHENHNLFDSILMNDERVVGEWMLVPHGTIYNLPHSNFVAFDLMTGIKRKPFDEFQQRCEALDQPKLIHRGGPYPLYKLFYDMYESGHGAEVAEGAVYRVHRQGEVDFLAKFVRPDHVPGKYLEGIASV